MSWRDLIPKTTISQETMEALGPVFMGQRLFNRGRYLEAEAMYCQALEHFPPKSAGRVLIYNKLGILYEKIGDSRRAMDSYEKGVKEGALTPFTYQRTVLPALGGQSPAPGPGLRPTGHQGIEKGPHQPSPGDLLLVRLSEAEAEDHPPHAAFPTKVFKSISKMIFRRPGVPGCPHRRGGDGLRGQG